MKIKYCIVLVFTGFFAYSQVDFQEHLILDNTYGVNSSIETYRGIVAADLNGDNLKDLVCADSRLQWYMNDATDEHLYRPPLNRIETESMPNGLCVDDLDGDGDNDILFWEFYNNENLSWVENLDGLGNFGEEQLLDTNSFGVEKKAVIEDIDADGDNDIVYLFRSQNGFDEGIKWIENTAEGFGAPQILFNSSDEFDDFFLVDLNNDNLPDLLTYQALSSSSDYIINGYENQGSNSFSLIETIDDFALSEYLEIYDYDNDGDMDILSHYRNGINNTLYVYKNLDGLGNFGNKTALQTFPSSQQQAYYVFKDLNNDGFTDFIQNYKSTDAELYTMKQFINSGNDTFTESIIYEDEKNVYTFVGEDLDNDNDIDLVSASGNSRLNLFLNNEGVYDSAYNISTLFLSVVDLSSGDIDGDGDNDVLVNTTSNGRLSWLENRDGLGNFSVFEHPVDVAKDYDDYLRDGKLVDLDYDGDLDIVATVEINEQQEDYEKLIWYENSDGLGTYSTAQDLYLYGDTYAHNISYEISDMDSDNVLDIVIYGTYYGLREIIILKNDGEANFEEHAISLDNIIYGVNTRLAVDYDNDGDKDIVVNAYDNGLSNVRWFENENGLAISSQAQTVIGDIGTHITGIRVEDFDNDSDKDILYTSIAPREIGWYENTGTTYSAEQTIADGFTEHIRNFKTIDLENDGDLDIILVQAQYGNYKLSSIANGGDGSFEDVQVIAEKTVDESFDFSTLNINDLNGDAKLDIIVSTQGHEGELNWYENLGDFMGVSESFENTEGQLVIYPNPTNGIFFIKHKHPIRNIQIFDTKGKLRSTYSELPDNGIDISHYSSGVYFVRVDDEKGNSLVKKIIKTSSR